jgi:hypothetical protein
VAREISAIRPGKRSSISRMSAAKLLTKDDLLTVARQYQLAGTANLGPVRLQTPENA